MFESAIRWGLIGAGTSSVTSLIKLYLDHNIFEKKCDEYWNRYKRLISRKFASQKKVLCLPKSFEEAIVLFDEPMNNLRTICNSTSPDWIFSSDGENFAVYMVQIAIVMDYAFQIINYY